MYLNDDQIEQMRKCADYLLRTTVPYVADDDNFSDVCLDYKGPPGTTCGFLCHWLLWRLGASPSNLSNVPKLHGGGTYARTTVNRTADGFNYGDGENIARIHSCPDFIWNTGFHRPVAGGPLHACNAFQAGWRPETGDIVYINAPEHVFCYLDGDDKQWITAESGQANGTDADIRDDRKVLPFNGKEWQIQGRPDFPFPTRTIMGWLPLDQLDFGPPPLPLPWRFHEPS